MEKAVDMVKERLRELDSTIRDPEGIISNLPENPYAQVGKNFCEDEEQFLKSLLNEMEKPTETETSCIPKAISVKKSAVIYKIYEEIQQVISKYDDSVILPAFLVLQSEYDTGKHPEYSDIKQYSYFIRGLRGIVSADEYLEKFQEAWGEQGSIDEFLTPEPEIEEEEINYATEH